MKYVLTSILFISFSIGIGKYLEKQSIEYIKIEKEMKIELAKQEVERLKAQANLYYSMTKYKRGY